MRSQLVVLSIIAAALSGCGKDVSREASLNAQANSLSLTGCGDRIGRPAYPQVDRLSDIVQNSGSYELTSFEAVATQTDASSRQVGVSVVSGTRQDGSMGYNQVCSDLSQMPNGEMEWSVSAPEAISAKTGNVDSETLFEQTIYGSAVRDEAGMPKAQVDSLNGSRSTSCKDITDMMRGQNCVAAEFFKIDANTIGVLRTLSARSDSGEIVTSKVFAQYSLTGADPTDTSTDTTPDTGGKKGKGKGKGKEGKKGGQGSGAQGGKDSGKDNSNANNSNNSNNANNVNNANNSNANAKVNSGKGEKGGKGGQGSGGQGSGAQGGSTVSDSNVTYVYPYKSLEDVYGPAIAEESDDSDDDSYHSHRHSRDSDETILKSKTKSKHKSKVTGSGVVKSKDKEKSKVTTVSEDGTITETKTKVKVKKKKAPRN